MQRKPNSRTLSQVTSWLHSYIMVTSSVDLMGKVWQIARPGGATATGATWNSALGSLRRVTPYFWHKDWPSPVQSTSATRDPGPPLISSISLSQSGFSFLQWPVKQKTMHKMHKMHRMHRMHRMHLPMSLAWAQHEFYCFTDVHRCSQMFTDVHSIERSEVALPSCGPHRTTGHRIWRRHSSLRFLPCSILQLFSNSQNQYQQIFQQCWTDVSTSSILKHTLSSRSEKLSQGTNQTSCTHVLTV